MKLEFQKCNQNDLKVLSQISKETFVTAFALQNNPKDFENYISKAFSIDTIDKELKDIASHFYFVYYRLRISLKLIEKNLMKQFSLQ